MDKMFENYKKSDQKNLQRYYQSFLKKGLSDDEAEQKAIKILRIGKSAKYVFVVCILVSVFGGIFSSKAESQNKSKLKQAVIEDNNTKSSGKEATVHESNLKPFRQNENSLEIIEEFAKANKYKMTEFNEPKTVSGIKINYYSKYFEKEMFLEKEKLNLRYNFYISYQDNKIDIFEILLNSDRSDKDSTQALFNILKKEFNSTKAIFNDEDYKVILSALDEAKSKKSDGVNFVTKSMDKMLVEIPVYKNQAGIRVSMEGN